MSFSVVLKSVLVYSSRYARIRHRDRWLLNYRPALAVRLLPFAAGYCPRTITILLTNRYGNCLLQLV
jgi:hypothetical protein